MCIALHEFAGAMISLCCQPEGLGIPQTCAAQQLHHLQVAICRTTDFWRRAFGIYGGYKVAQLRATVLRAAGHSEIQLKENLWRYQHEWAGENMYKLAVDMRGFYLKVKGSRWLRCRLRE